MNIAIPLFNDRISPHFSTSPEILIVLVEKNKVYSVSKLNVVALSGLERRKKIVSLGVDTILCGGIDEVSREWFRLKGVRIIENIMGDAMDALNDFLGREKNKDLIKKRFAEDKIKQT
ncbi:MAG TPA: NifB/NifX family molybdenum-iron cluster-binding protein [Syntrophorhabdaceae bacterium]|nr:NifB/NifX family molybdenum-iron cluster-binding protein [Syntrophorhabdaceae bacterium]